MIFVKTQPGTSPIVVEAHLPAAPAQVFDSWTDPEVIKKWFGREPGMLSAAEIDLRPGGRWRFVETFGPGSPSGFEGQYLTIEPNELLIFTWSKIVESSSATAKDKEYSKVEIQLVANGAGTDMTIVHSALVDVDSSRNFAFGWEVGVANLVGYISETEQ